MKKYLLSLIIAFLCVNPIYSLELDMSVDAEIRKKYDSNKLNEEILPPLPKVAPSSPQKNTKTYIPSSHSVISLSSSESTFKIPAGTKFQVKSNSKIADWLKPGTKVSFTTTSAVTKKNYTVPKGTIIIGEIVKSHSPQITGNGGLVIVKITEIKLNNNYYLSNGKITKANGKKIFFNRIKGKRQYLAGVSGQVNKGENFYKKSRKMSSKWGDNPLTYIISPVPTVVGLVGYGTSVIISPVVGAFKKGKNSAFSENTTFEIKLLDSVYLK